MNDPNETKKQVLEEILNSKNLGNKKYHSETSLQQYGDDEEPVFDEAEKKDPGVSNMTMTDLSRTTDPGQDRRRTMSQPGPVGGNLVTAGAARAARKRIPRNVMYSSDLERSDSNNDKQTLKPPIYRGDGSGSITPNTGERNSPFMYNNLNGNIGNGTYKNADTKSLSSYRMYIPVNDVMRGNATPRKRSVATMDAQSLRSIETHAPPPTSPEDNKRLTTKYLTLVMSSIYAILLVTVGIIVYLGDTFVDMSVSPIYSIALCGVGFIYLIYLIIDINRYKAVALKNQRIKGRHDEQISEYFRKQEEDFNSSMPPTPGGERTPELYRPPGIPPPVLIPLTHQYCFSQGRHSGSFYLKLGAAGFAIGHLVHSVLLIAVQLGFLLDEDLSNEECLDILQVVLDFMFPCYCFFQLYFIFKYSNVIILRAQGLAHFAFMHMIGSSLCFWVSAIVRETVLALTIYANSIYGSGRYNTTETDDYTSDVKVYNGTNDDYSWEPYRIRLIEERFLDISSLYNEKCYGSRAINTIAENFSPYLYPFSVEFNILIVAVYYIIWSNIGNCHNEDNNSEINSTYDESLVCKIPTANEENNYTSNIVIHADCHASNRGLFAGIMLLVIVIGILIIGFVFSSVGGDFLVLGSLLNDCLKLGLHSVMLIGAVFAFNQLHKLDINEHPISLLDDVLLFICLPAFFLETVLSMLATVNIINIVKSIDLIVMVIQVIIQTPLIMDGLRRCSNNKKLRRSKPGREILMFLLIANVSTWLFNTFSYKSPESLDERYEFYGKVLWTILGHVSLPLIMFYRFHSSVCFADIWDSAYKPGLEH